MLEVEIGNPAPGDSFLLGGLFTLSDNGGALDGEPTGIRLERQDDTTWRFTSADPVEIGLYEDLLNSVGLTTDLEDPTPGTLTSTR